MSDCQDFPSPLYTCPSRYSSSSHSQSIGTAVPSNRSALHSAFDQIPLHRQRDIGTVRPPHVFSRATWQGTITRSLTRETPISSVASSDEEVRCEKREMCGYRSPDILCIELWCYLSSFHQTIEHLPTGAEAAPRLLHATTLTF